MEVSTQCVATAATSEQPDDSTRRRAIRGAFFSEFVDMFDVFLPVAVLSPVLFFFQPSNLVDSPLTSLVFVTTLLGRPLGALIFGVIADRVGRRNASILSSAGFATVTMLIALLPGYEVIGMMSYWLLVLLRFVDGIFLGGGYTGPIPLAIESAPKDRRGFVGGLIIAGFPAAYLTTNLLAALMFALFPLDGASSPYAQWGWRIPFMIGSLLAAALSAYYVFKVEESEVWRAEAMGKVDRLPLTDLIRGKSARSLAQVFLLMTGLWTTQNIITLFLPVGLLTNILHLNYVQSSATLVVTYTLMIFSYVGAGVLSQSIGRRNFFIVVSLLIATAGSGMLFVLANVARLSLVSTVSLVCVLAILVTSPWGGLLTYINERFVTDVRATGFGVSFSLSVIIPSFYAFYLTGLSAVTPGHAAPAILLCAGGIIAAVGAIIGPETKDVDF
ncbi:MAG: MFS transporter [Pseudomonadota bacterium]|uniref:MFS transporter n=1 Tax=Burkholderiaceae TaxID=119060 RepID=UPI0010F9192A